MKKLYVCLILFVAVGFPIASQSIQPKTMTSFLAADVASLNPITARGYFMPQALLISPFLQRGNDGEYLPNVAKTYNLSDDGLTIRMELDPTMKFADGRTVTKDDILGSFDYIRENGFQKDLLMNMESIGFDGWTLVIKLKQVSPAFVYSILSMSYGGILDMEKARRTSVAEFNLKPAGYGLYALEEYSQGLRLSLKKNPYYRSFNPMTKNKGPALLDKVVFRIIPDAFTVANEFLAGTIDYIPEATNELVSLVKGKSQYKVLENPEAGTLFLQLNFAKPPLDDPRVRAALSKAIDRSAFVELRNGGAYEQHTLLIPVMTGYTEGAAAYCKSRIGYDPTGAKALLAQAGYVDGNRDGILEKDGKNLSIVLLSNREEEQLVLFQALWNKVGFDVKIERSSGAAFSASVNSGKWDVIFNRIRTLEPTPFYYLLSSSPKVPDNLLAAWKSADATSVASRRAAILDAAQKKLIGDGVYVIPVFSYKKFEALSSSLVGEVEVPGGMSLAGYGFYQDMDLKRTK